MILDDFIKHPNKEDDHYSVWKIRKGWIEESIGEELTLEEFKSLCDEYDMNGDDGSLIDIFTTYYGILVESGEIKRKEKTNA